MTDDNLTTTSSNLDDTPAWHDPYSSVTSNGLFADTEEVTKLGRLSKAKDTKLYALTKLNNGANLDDSYTDLGNGIVESNKNKIWNDLSDLGIQSLNAYAKAEKALTRNEDGSTVDSQGNYLRSNTKWLYEFGTKDRESSVTKMGLARGDEDVTNRYIKYPSGELGVDIEQLKSSTLYTSPVATMLEAVRHGRKQALSSRVVKDRYTDTATTDLLGGGSSEYYTSREGVLGVPMDVDMELGKRLFDEYMAKLPNKYRSFANKEKVLPLSKPDSVINAVSGFGATFVNELFVKPADAIGDLTGLYDADTNGDTQKSVEDFFGYDSRAVEEAQHKVGEYWDVVANSEATVTERMRAAGNGMLEMFITPEMMGTSFGALMAWVAPGTLLTKGIGIGSKFANAAKAIDASVKAGKITKMSGRVEKAKKFLELDGAKGLLASQSGQVTAALGNVNKQFEEFVANNNGVVPEGWDKAKFFATGLPVQLLNQNLDKLVTLDIIKGSGVVKALAPALKAMTNKEFGNVVTTLTKGFAVTLKNSGEEAAQEYAQTSMELFNSRYGSEQFKDLDTFVKFLSSSKNIREAGIASLAGAGGSGQFEFAGAVGSGIRGVTRTLVTGGQDVSPESEVSEDGIRAIVAGMYSFASDSAVTDPAAIFYAEQGSGVEELRTKANNYAAVTYNSIVDGSNAIFHSDAEVSPEGISKLIEIAVAANPKIDLTALKTVVDRSIKNKGEVVTEEMSTAIDKAYKAGSAFRRVKTMSEVAGEVSAGAKGFVTYYNAAKAAEHSGDTKLQAASIDNLEIFRNYEATKAARLQSGVERVESFVISEAESLVAQKKAASMYDAFGLLRKKYKKAKDGGATTIIKNADKANARTTAIPHYDVALKLGTSNTSKPFIDGIYGLVRTVNSEVASMDSVLGSLQVDTPTSPTSNVSSITQVQESQETNLDQALSDAEAELKARDTPVVESTETVVPTKAEDYQLPDDIAEWVSNNPDVPGTIKLKAAIAAGKMTPTLENNVFKSIRARIARENTQNTADKKTKKGSTETAAIHSNNKQFEFTVKAYKEFVNNNVIPEGIVEYMFNKSQSEEVFTSREQSLFASSKFMKQFEQFAANKLAESGTSTETIDTGSIDDLSASPQKEVKSELASGVSYDEELGVFEDKDVGREISKEENTRRIEFDRINNLTEDFYDSIKESDSEEAIKVNWGAFKKEHNIPDKVKPEEVISSDNSELDTLSMLAGAGGDIDNSYDPSLYTMDGDNEVSESQQGEDTLAAMLAAASSDQGVPAEQFVDDGDFSLEDMLVATGTSTTDNGDYTLNDVVPVGNEDDYNITGEEDTNDTFINTQSLDFRKRKKRKVKEQDKKVNDFQTVQNEIVASKTEIDDRKEYLRREETDVTKIAALIESDEELQKLLGQLKVLKESLNTFESDTKKHIEARIAALPEDRRSDSLELFEAYRKEDTPKYTLKDLFSDIKTTGFTVENQTEKDVHKETIKFGESLESVIVKVAPTYFAGIQGNITGFLMYNVDGTLNYNTVQVMHAAVNDYMLRNSEHLFGADRGIEDLAEILGADENTIDERDEEALLDGGVTLRLSSSDIGKTIMKNLGIKPSNIAAADGLATELGIAALQGYADKAGTGIESAVLTRTRNVYTSGGPTATGIDLIVGNDQILGKLGTMGDTNKDIEERLDVKIDSSRSYRKGRKGKPRKVKQHHAEHLDAPKEHTDAVNRLENTAFKFNSGNMVLEELFDREGTLDKEALVDKIIGPVDIDANYDDAKAYVAQRAALMRSLDDYTKAMEDMSNTSSAELFFDWFIAKNHRMHLDSGGINPQSDKHIARWLLTAAGSQVDIDKATIAAVVSRNYIDETDHYVDKGIMTAKAFAYAIVQAFDGAKGIPGIDKDPEYKILAIAQDLLDEAKYPDEVLLKMAMKAGHIGHAALAIANIRKFRDGSGVLDSDMVLEVDGLTNGFAFRALQYPISSTKSPVPMQQWLEKVGVVQVEGSSKDIDGNPISDLESMNAARGVGQEDVYISTGGVFGEKVKAVKTGLKRSVSFSKKKKNQKPEQKKKAEEQENKLKWVTLFEKHGKLPDFGLGKTGNPELYAALLKFIRNLMKNPTMIFGYAASLKRISSGLVRDQIMGKGYLKGKGLVAFLTSKHPRLNEDGTENEEAGEYIVSEAELLQTFGHKGHIYHKARVDLKTHSLVDKSKVNITIMKEDLASAITELYAEPIEQTLKELFEEQTKVNAALIQAGEFLYKHFENEYNKHIVNNPLIDEKGKMEWLKTYATYIPGIAGASSTDQRTKLMFLKNVLEETNNSVITKKFKRKDGSLLHIGTNTVTRGYGEPGVGPAVLTILSLDSSNLATSINEFYKTHDYANVVPVHDAIVLGVGDYGVIKQYSKDFYLINKRYSIVAEFEKAVGALSSRLSTTDKINLYIPGGFDKNGKAKDPITFLDMQNHLGGVAIEVAVARGKLFENDFKIGQMVGPNGTMYITDVAGDKAKAIDYVRTLATRISNVMSDKELQRALGKTYKKHSSLLEAMLKGCTK